MSSIRGAEACCPPTAMHRRIGRSAVEEGVEDLEPLVQRAASGDRAAAEELLGRCRKRLRQMVAARMHPRLAGRCDPSDIVQDVLADALRRLPEYVTQRSLPFFVWLRQIGLDRLADYCRRHLYAQSRSVFREEDVALSDDSVAALASHLVGSSSGPYQRMMQEEAIQHLRTCLEKLRPADRELLLMRFAEQLQIPEIAAALAISEAAAKSRTRRALESLQALFGDDSGKGR